MNSHNSKLLPFYCSECGKEFKFHEELFSHSCSRKVFKKQLRQASSDAGPLFGSSE